MMNNDNKNPFLMGEGETTPTWLNITEDAVTIDNDELSLILYKSMPPCFYGKADLSNFIAKHQEFFNAAYSAYLRNRYGVTLFGAIFDYWQEEGVFVTNTLWEAVEEGTLTFAKKYCFDSTAEAHKSVTNFRKESINAIQDRQIQSASNKPRLEWVTLTPTKGGNLFACEHPLGRGLVKSEAQVRYVARFETGHGYGLIKGVKDGYKTPVEAQLALERYFKRHQHTLSLIANTGGDNA